MQVQNKTINLFEMLSIMFSSDFDKSDWEFSWGTQDEWFTLSRFEENQRYLTEQTALVFRKIQKTQVINGFTVPVPVKDWKELKVGYYYYCPCFTKEDIVENFKIYEYPDTVDRRLLKRGLVFKTQEDALVVAKAMLGINSYE